MINDHTLLHSSISFITIQQPSQLNHVRGAMQSSGMSECLPKHPSFPISAYWLSASSWTIGSVWSYGLV